MVIDDHLLLGGENSRFYVVRLDRGFDADGRVTVDPSVVFQTPAWDDELLAAVGRELSIENSVAVSGDTIYFANSGGLIQGWDLSGLTDNPNAVPERVFHFWAGDDVDGSLVIDAEGMIYAGIEYQRGTARSREVGQIIKLDPTKPDDPARVERARPRGAERLGRVGHPRPAPRHPHRAHPHRPRLRHRHRHRRSALGQEALRPRVAESCNRR